MDKFGIGIAIAFFAAQAPAAQILATNEDGKKVSIAVDEKGTARIDGREKSYPTIKDFRDENEFYDYCYEGAEKEVKALLTELVAAADGDGDSYATLESIERDASGKFTVTATIEDEGGTREEVFEFSACKKVQD